MVKSVSLKTIPTLLWHLRGGALGGDDQRPGPGGIGTLGVGGPAPFGLHRERGRGAVGTEAKRIRCILGILFVSFVVCMILFVCRPF